jgi:hypothetical protein
MKCVLWLSLQLWNIFHSKKNCARCDQKKLLVLMPDSNESWTFWTDFQKYSGIKFSENPPSGSRVVPCGQTDIHDEANSRFPQFCERAYKWTTYWSATPTETPRSVTSTMEPLNDRRTRWLTGNLRTRQLHWIRRFVELLKTRRPTGERRRRSRRPSCERNRSGSKWTSDPWLRDPYVRSADRWLLSNPFVLKYAVEHCSPSERTITKPGDTVMCIMQFSNDVTRWATQ